MREGAHIEADSEVADDRCYAPLLIGIVGKRNLQHHDDAVREALTSAFDIIDENFQLSPKILLSALAEGADTLAAVAVLGRKEWRVVAPLPLPLELYAEDFDPAAAERLRKLLRHPDVRSHVLPALRDPRTDAPFTPADLSRSESNPHRADHYEQVGLYIAECSALLIAVLPADETPGRVGGTARIVAARQLGPFDSKCRDVVARSTVLHSGALLDPPAGGPIWRIDLKNVEAFRNDPKPFDVLLSSAQERGAGLSAARKLRGSLNLFKRLEDFNGRVAAIPEAAWRRNVGGPAADRPDDAATILLRQRNALSLIQGEAKKAVRACINGLALLFVLAVLAFEIYIAAPESYRGYALIANLGIIVAALIVYWVARYNRWSTYAEDYRAAAEALRVQLAWWDAGLRSAGDRVDHIFMRGAVGSRTLIRAGVRSLIHAAILTGGVPREPPDLQRVERTWVGLPDNPESSHPDGQIGYFAKRVKERHGSIALVELLSWSLFMGALGLAIFLLLAWLHVDGTVRAWMATLAGGMIVLILVATGAIGIRATLLLLAKHGTAAQTHGRRRHAVAAFCGLSAGLFGAAWLYGVLGGTPTDHSEWRLHLLVIISVVIAAVAGAIRFVAEKLSLEAEGRSYLEARALFRYAAERLRAAREDPTRSQDERDQERCQIIRELGREALKENEAWVRAHRERPLEPLIGS